MSNRKLKSWAVLAVAYATLVTLIVLRAIEVDRTIGVYIDCQGCFHTAVITSDLIVLAAFTFLLLVSSLARPDGFRKLLQALAGVPLLVYGVDLLLFHFLSVRLFMADVALFVREYAALWNQLAASMGGSVPAIALLVAVLGLFLSLYRMPRLRFPGQRALLSGILALFLAAGSVGGEMSYVNDWVVESVFSANWESGSKRRYSPERVKRIRSNPPPAERLAVDGGDRPVAPPDVIIVLLESWSSWHSALFGGYEDWTPQLDAAARRGLRFENFHAIGFATDRGLMGILAGQPLWAPFIHWYQATPFHSVWGVQRTLPRTFGRGGYKTAFLTSGPLDLLRKGEWMVDLGFDYVEGNEHPHYSDLPQFAFGAASDKALYERAEQWRGSAEQPFLLVLETVTSHQPYLDPDSGDRSLELAMKYADRAFGAYLARLEQTGFFERGVLMVVSDHRSMTPISALEFERFGLAAYSRVPAFVIGPGFNAGSIDRSVYSQSDIVPSFAAWLGEPFESKPADSLMWGVNGAQPSTWSVADCAFHRRGNERELVNVICGDGEGVFRLDGDDTAFLESRSLDADRRGRILEYVAWLRLEGLARDERMLSEVD